MARPTKYRENFPDMIQGYLDNHETKYGDVVPTIEGVAVMLGVATKTLYAWYHEEITEEFCNIFEQVMAHQGKKLINGGLKSEYNSAITKMMLTKHGYSDSVDHSSKDKSMSPVQIVDDIPDDKVN